jgi:hypothetical protein
LNGSLLTSERKHTHFSPTRPNCTERTGMPEGRRPGTARRGGNVTAGRVHRPVRATARAACGRPNVSSPGHFGVVTDAGAVRKADQPPDVADRAADRVPGTMSPAAFRQVGPHTAGGIHSRSSARPTGLSSGFSPAANWMTRCFPGCDRISGNELSERVRSIQSGRTAATGEPILSTSHLVPRLGQTVRAAQLCAICISQ